jgi:two-component system, chemotaxis family, chemotaxis protein CheY
MANLKNVSKEMPVLIVDDYGTMRKMMRGCLASLGFQNVHEAENGEEALEKLENGSFALVISDWNMPVMKGIDLLKAMKKHPRFHDIPFLMVTAESEEENIVEAGEAGAAHYLLKPFDAQEVQESLELIFDGDDGERAAK